MTSVPPSRVFAYGDRDGDGVVQMSFALPMPASTKAREAARRFATLHGLSEPLVATMESLGDEHSYFVVYGRSAHFIDPTEIDVCEAQVGALSHEEIEERLAKILTRKVVVVGACTGADAHTVGIDAILNYKGYAGSKGLESYRGFEVHNLGAQVENEELVARTAALRADVVLVSQVVTQRDCHKENAFDLVARFKARGLRRDVLLLLGGPRIDNALALELGFDAGFGPGTTPRDVANFIVEQIGNQRVWAEPKSA